MALAAPAMVTVASGQDVEIDVPLLSYPPGGILSWTTSATLRAYNGGPVLGTGTVTPTDTGTAASYKIVFNAADTAQPPGGYVWQFERTNAGADFDICDTSAFRITGRSDTPYPTFTNLSELLAQLDFIVGTPTDVQVKKFTQMLAAAEAFVHRYCGRRNFFYQQYTEFFDAPVKDNPRLAETPVWNMLGLNFDPNGGFGQLAGTFDQAIVTVSITSPCIVSYPSHGFQGGELIQFTTTGTLPTGLSSNAVYYVLAAGLATDTFRVSLSPGGSAVNTSGTQSGSITLWKLSSGTTSLAVGTDFFLNIDRPDGKSYGGELYTTRQAGWAWWGWGPAWWGRGYTPGLIGRLPQPIPGAFRAVYNAGYTLIPDDLKQAIWWIVADWNSMSALGTYFQSEAKEGYSYSRGPHDVLVFEILNGYKDGRSYVA